VRQWLTTRSSSSDSGPYYLVTILPDQQSIAAFGGEHPIPANMQVNAYVLLDSRPLYQWILEPLYSISHAWRNH
jgi:membrane fusion protein